MEREKLFEEFLKACEEKKHICGQGNPNADILIIGKESTDTSEELIREKIMLCKDQINRDAPRLIDRKNKTWTNYQKLLDEIYHRESDYPNKWDFEKYAFTTELSSVPRKQSNYSEAKSSIQDRLHFFKESKFVQSFPVIILACGGYIRNQGEGADRQIDNTFDVEFDGELKGWHKNKNGKLWLTTHHSKDKQKLVIHTWQFSLRCTTTEDKEWLMNQMAKVIRDHLTKLGLL